MESKHCNTDGRTAWTAMLKTEPHLFTFHERILVSLWTFQSTILVCFPLTISMWLTNHFQHSCHEMKNSAHSHESGRWKTEYVDNIFPTTMPSLLLWKNGSSRLVEIFTWMVYRLLFNDNENTKSKLCSQCGTQFSTRKVVQSYEIMVLQITEVIFMEINWRHYFRSNTLLNATYWFLFITGAKSGDYAERWCFEVEK